jgi:hypothetical protein
MTAAPLDPSWIPPTAGDGISGFGADDCVVGCVEEPGSRPG